jgi:LSD1 subclass zinc finger protein
MVMEIKQGDIVQLKKKHPCGSDRWQVVRTGADIGIICLGCRHRIMLERGAFEKRVKTFVSRAE